MSVTYLEQPADIGLSKNPLIFKLNTDNEYSAAGSKAAQFFELTSLPTQNDTFTLQWNEIELTFTITAAGSMPNNSGLQIPTASSGTLQDYIDDVFIPAIADNYYVHRDFDVQRTNNDVQFYAREKGTAFNINFTSGNQSWNNGFNNYSPGTDPVRRENFRLICRLYYRYVGEATYQVIEAEKVPLESQAVFDAAEMLSNLQKIIRPAPDRATALAVSGQMIEYYLEAAEAYGETLSVQKLYRSADKLALFGGFDEKDRDDHTFVDDILPDNLTWRQQTKILPGQPYFITFFNSFSHTSWEVDFDLHFTDGTSLTESAFITFSCAQNRQFLVPCGYNIAASVPNINHRPIDYYRVWIRKNNEQEPANGIVTIHVNQQHGPDAVFFAYQNSLNAFETQSCSGTFTNLREYEGFTADAAAAYNKAYADKGPVAFNKRYTPRFEINTGHLTKDEADRFNDLLAAQKTYLVFNNKWVPVAIENKTYQLRASLSGRQNAFLLSVSLAKEKNYSHAGSRIG